MQKWWNCRQLPNPAKSIFGKWSGSSRNSATCMMLPMLHLRRESPCVHACVDQARHIRRAKWVIWRKLTVLNYSITNECANYIEAADVSVRSLRYFKQNWKHFNFHDFNFEYEDVSWGQCHCRQNFQENRWVATLMPSGNLSCVCVTFFLKVQAVLSAHISSAKTCGGV